MRLAIRGQRPRPRVALLGDFGDGDLDRYRRAFPTLWVAGDEAHLEGQVAPSEVDLLVVAGNVGTVGSFAYKCHTICFSSKIDSLPGPVDLSWASLQPPALTEHYGLPEVRLPFSRRRDADLLCRQSVKGWPRLALYVTPGPKLVGPQESGYTKARSLFYGGSLIIDAHSGYPFATTYLRAKTGLGLAWLPYPVIDQVAWVEVIAQQWAESDRQAFGGYGDWVARREWMTREELDLAARIEALEKERDASALRLNGEIHELQDDLAQVSLEASNGRRRLLTGQGEQLADEVAKAFEEWGFVVRRIDDELEGQPKREDLRLQDPSAPEGWEAIVEVRGYKRSGGPTSDLQRLGGFALKYEREEGRPPDLMVYVVNGEIEAPPYARQEPFASAEDDVEVFGDHGGAVVWSVDLFRAAQASGRDAPARLRESLKHARGRWRPSPEPRP